jgi:hypothetical protein
MTAVMGESVKTVKPKSGRKKIAIPERPPVARPVLVRLPHNPVVVEVSVGMSVTDRHLRDEERRGKLIYAIVGNKKFYDDESIAEWAIQQNVLIEFFDRPIPKTTRR